MNQLELWHEIAEKEAAIASKVIKRMFWLKPGTYTAKEVHQAIQQRCGSKYYCEYMAPKLSQGKIFKIKFDRGQISSPLSNIFYELHKAERRAGESGRKAHQWTIPSSGKLIAKTTFIMPPQNTMNKLGGTIKFIYGKEARLTFSLHKDVMTVSDKSEDVLTLNISNYDRTGIPQGTVYIDPNKLKYLYDKCTLRFYMDPMSESISLMITNADGWSTSFSCEGTNNITSMVL